MRHFGYRRLHNNSSRRHNPLWVCIHSPFNGVLASSFEVSRSHTTTRHSRQDSSERVISSSQRPLPDNTHHLRQTNFHARSGIRTHNLSRRAAVDPRLKPRGYWNRHKIITMLKYLFFRGCKCNSQHSRVREISNSCEVATNSSVCLWITFHTT